MIKQKQEQKQTLSESLAKVDADDKDKKKSTLISGSATINKKTDLGRITKDAESKKHI